MLVNLQRLQCISSHMCCAQYCGNNLIYCSTPKHNLQTGWVVFTGPKNKEEQKSLTLASHQGCLLFTSSQSH